MEGGTDAITELSSEVRGRVLGDAGAREARSRDASHLRESPAAVLLPAGVDDLLAVVRWARRHHVGLVARGGGTSLDGESVPARGSVVVDFSEWQEVGPVDRLGRWVEVGPGVVNAALDRRLEPAGLFFPPNPGSWRSSTIGGNVATNACGPRSFAYGPTRSWVLGLTAVTGAGELLCLGGPAPKRSTGPSLLDLLVGSEGTLALTARLTLRLALRPARRVGLIVPLKPQVSAAELALRLVKAGGNGISAIEYVDQAVAAELSRRDGSRLPGDRPLVLLEVEGSEEEIDGRLERLEGLLMRWELSAPAAVYPNANDLWTLRGESGAVLERSMGERVREDVCVPIPRLAELFRLLDDLAQRFSAPLATFGHLGEGNLHPNFGVDPGAPVADALRAALYEGVRALGGSISGEHGIGLVKARWLVDEHGVAGVEALRRVKAAFDPDGILNPGKVLPSR